MEYVDLRKRREDRARRKKPDTPPRNIARDPLLLVGSGFVLGSAVSHLFLTGFYTGDPYALFVTHPLMIFVAVIALLLYALWLLVRRSPAAIVPKLGSEKQLLLAILDAGGAVTPVEAALETSLTVDEAEEILTRFADRGHLIVESRDGALAYTLPGRGATSETRTV